MKTTKIPAVFVIILNYNGARVLPTCLNSVFQSDYPRLEVVVVDNSSSDDSFEQARSNFSRVHFIRNPKNIGFARGNNIGIRFALEKFADYVFLLNNDTTIEKTTISKLVKTASEKESAGIVSPLIYSSGEKSIWFAGGTIYWNKMRAAHKNSISSESPYLTQYASGCAMLVKNKVLKKIGLFDERFFLYYEDTDLSIRARKEGFDIFIDPSTKITHLEQSSSTNSSKIYWLVLSGLIFFHTHSSLLQKAWFLIFMRIRKMKNFLDIIFSRNAYAQDIRRAFKDYRKSY